MMKETGQRIYISGAIKEALFTVGRELLFLNKIKRLTAQNDIDKDGREGSHGGEGWGCLICACMQTSTSITIKA